MEIERERGGGGEGDQVTTQNLSCDVGICVVTKQQSRIARLCM